MGNVNNEEIKANNLNQPSANLVEPKKVEPKKEEVIQQPTPKMAGQTVPGPSQNRPDEKRVGAYNGQSEPSKSGTSSTSSSSLGKGQESKSGSSFGSSQNSGSQPCDPKTQSC